LKLVAATPNSTRLDDNASAVALLLATARAIGSHESICYVAFNGEERGFVGSEALVESLGCTRPGQVHILEMVGFTNKACYSQKSLLIHSVLSWLG